MAVTPSGLTLQLINTSQQFKAVGTFSDGSSKDLTASVSWSTSDPTVMRVINDPALNGLGTPISPGSASVSATLGRIVGSTQVTVATDGLSDWVVRQVFGGGGYAGLAYSGSRYVDLTLQMTSTDGTTWHPLQGGRSISESYQYGLVWTGSEFVTWGNVSSDGLHWTPHDLSSISANASIQRIAWSGTQLVAISGDQRYQILYPLAVSLLFSSPDGVNWTQHLGPYQDPNLSAITWTGSQFYVIGLGGTVMSSPDGVAWTGLTAAGPVGVRAAAASPTRLVAVGGTGGSDGNGAAVAPIQASQDGITWSAVSPPAWTGADFFDDVIWNGSQFVAVGGVTRFAAVGAAGVVATSPDGLTWALHGSPEYIEHVIWSGSQFVAEGPSLIQTSPDGVNWTSATSATPGAGYVLGVVWSGSTFVAVTGANTIVESPNGISWTTAYTSPTNVPLTCIAWSGTLYVACTSNGFLTSPDGATWTFRPNITITFANALLWAGSRFVAVAGNAVLTSPDGITWTTPSMPATATTEFTSVAWTGARYVVAGTSGLFTSTDAVTWTTAGIPGVWVAWNGKQLVAADNASPSNVYTSADGTAWTKHAVPFTFLGGPARVGPIRPSLIWTGSQFLAQGCSVAAGGAQVCNIFSSADGVVWTVALSMTYPDFQLVAAASNSSRTVMMGTPMNLSLP